MAVSAHRHPSNMMLMCSLSMSMNLGPLEIERERVLRYEYDEY